VKLVVSALASIIPDSDILSGVNVVSDCAGTESAIGLLIGIEAFNHKIYQGLPIFGFFSQSQSFLLSNLQKQLNASEQDLNILLGDAEEEGYCQASDLNTALQLAENALLGDINCVNIFGIEKSFVENGIHEIQNFAYAENFSFIKNNDSNTKTFSNFALAFSIKRQSIKQSFSQQSTEKAHDLNAYFACIESYADKEDSLKFGSSLNSEHNIFNYVESLSSSSESDLISELRSLSSYVDQKEDTAFEIALGSVALNVGYAAKRLDIAGFMKAVLQCYHRYIAGVPNWSCKNISLPWEGSSCYVPNASRFWFVENLSVPRIAQVIKSGQQSMAIQLSDRGLSVNRPNQYFSYAAPYFFPIVGVNYNDFEKKLTWLKQSIAVCFDNTSLGKLAKQNYEIFTGLANDKPLDEGLSSSSKRESSLRLVILGENREILLKECDAMLASLEKLFSDDNVPQVNKPFGEIKTPKGSYFTAQPLGKKGKLAFVFPGLGSSYSGLGQDIFQLFPQIYQESFRFTQNVGEELQEKSLYPRTQNTMTFKEKRQHDLELLLSLKDLGKIDTTYSSICSHVMTDVFQLKPIMALGYSMGEANMMAALDIWQKPTELEQRFRNSDIFKNRLYGDVTTLKRLWKLNDNVSSESIWQTYTLKASKQLVQTYIDQEKNSKVFLTLVNTAESVVIAGEPQACMDLINALNVRAVPMGFVPAIHSKPAAIEYDGIADLYSMPVNKNCDIKLYSSSCYLPVPIREKTIAYSIAKCFSEQVDFPRLVNKTYEDGARIFVEVGAGRICSTWIDKILQNKNHVVVPLNAKGTDDSLTFSRVLAKLVCHKVDVNLSPLFLDNELLNSPQL